jgi:hypothetical protein
LLATGMLRRFLERLNGKHVVQRFEIVDTITVAIS